MRFSAQVASIVITVGTLASSAPALAGTSGFIVVNPDGSEARGLNATGALHLQTGSYEADFNSKVSKCAYTGSVGLSGREGTSPAGYLTVVGRANNSKAVFVHTYDSTGQLADLGFHLEVTC